MSGKHRWIFSLCFLIIFSSMMNVGCAGNKLLREHEGLKTEKTQLEEENQKMARDCEEEKKTLKSQLEAKATELQRTRESLGKEAGELRQRIEQLINEKELVMKEEEEGLIISLPSNILFNKGSYQLRWDIKPLLKTLAEYIRNHPDRMVIVKGYTCNLPIHTSLFPTNWELSTRRATEVVRYFIGEERLSPQQFSAMGFGEYHPQFSNETEAERTKNRRVDLVILSEKLTTRLTSQ